MESEAISDMVRTLGEQVILAHTPHCIVRQQESQHLIYNNKTDEMHLVSPTGAYIYELCNGVSSVGEIERSIADVVDESGNNVCHVVREFLCQLVTRGILYEVVDVSNV